MTLIVASLALLIVLQFALWAVVRRARSGGDGARHTTDRRAARNEMALWLVGAGVIVVLLALLARGIYTGQRTQRENSRHETSSTRNVIS